jgi:hypothetical protein
MIRHDLKVEADYINANNDVEWFESDIVHIEDTINSNVGEWKEHPQDGVSIANFLNSSGQGNVIKRKAIIQLKSDLYDCNNPLVTYGTDGTLTINPNIEL